YICKGVINVVNPVEMPINILEKPPFFNNVEWKLIVLESLSFISGISIEKLSEAFDIVYREGDLAAISKAHEASILIPFIELLNRKPDYDKLINSLRNGVLIDLSGYGTVFQNSYASLLVNMAKHIFLAEKDPINTLFIIDDAWRVIKMRAIVEMVKEGRSRKLGVIISTQNPDDIPQEILENIYNIVFFGSKNEEYLLKAKKILGLPNQMVSVLSKLTIGEAVFLNLLNKTPLVFEINTPLKYNDRSRV
ncbi:MAG: ATP-binding protein, partial [Desulfurococcaceae archaeon]